MRIAIKGSGGVGAYVGGRLLAPSEDVVFIARGAHLASMPYAFRSSMSEDLERGKSRRSLGIALALWRRWLPCLASKLACTSTST